MTEAWTTFARMTDPTIAIPESHPWEGSYLMELGRIEYTHIGFEDHGIFSWAIGFTFGGTAQGTGHYTFTPEMLDITKDVLTVVGSDTWENLVNKRVYVLRAKVYGKIVGLANVENPEFKWMFFPS